MVKGGIKEGDEIAKEEKGRRKEVRTRVEAMPKRREEVGGDLGPH